MKYDDSKIYNKNGECFLMNQVILVFKNCTSICMLTLKIPYKSDKKQHQKLLDKKIVEKCLSFIACLKWQCHKICLTFFQ